MLFPSCSNLLAHPLLPRRYHCLISLVLYLTLHPTLMTDEPESPGHVYDLEKVIQLKGEGRSWLLEHVNAFKAIRPAPKGKRGLDGETKVTFARKCADEYAAHFGLNTETFPHLTIGTKPANIGLFREVCPSLTIYIISHILMALFTVCFNLVSKQRQRRSFTSSKGALCDQRAFVLWQKPSQVRPTNRFRPRPRRSNQETDERANGHSRTWNNRQPSNLSPSTWRDVGSGMRGPCKVG